MRKESGKNPSVDPENVCIRPVTGKNLDTAAEVHAVSWRASHAGICAPAYVAAHTRERQRDYLTRKLNGGSRFFLLYDPDPVGVVSVTGSLIEDLYVLPACQGRGYGTALLRHAIRECAGTPTLWILETNHRARRLYERLDFRPTGRVNRDHGPLAEIEYALSVAYQEKEILLETSRLLVRRLKEDDAEALFEVLSDPEVMRYIEPPFSLEQTRAFIREAGLCQPPLVWAVLWKGDAADPAILKPQGFSPILIGHLIWHSRDDSSMELGWILRRDFWGRGIARELTAAMLGQTDGDVVIECSPAQAATRHMAEAFGFELLSSNKDLVFYRRNRNDISGHV